MLKFLTKKNRLIIFSLIAVFALILSFFVRSKIYNKIKQMTKSKMVWGIPDEEKNHMDGIPIVITLDDGYCLQGVVTLSSLLKNANTDTFYKISVLIPPEFKEDSKKKLLSVQENYKNNCIIEFIKMNDCFKNSYISNHFTEVVYFRLRIPDILKKRKKCIYMDTDIIVEKDLTELYNQPLDEKWIAGVADTARIYKDEKQKQEREFYKIKFEFPSLDQCINSGVLLWNLEACRENKTTEKFKAFLEKHSKVDQHDQLTINVTCYDHIKTLPLKFNTQVFLNTGEPYGKDEEKFSTAYTEEEWKDAWASPFIIHYAGEKPWQDPSVFWVEKWWITAKQTLYYKEILKKNSIAVAAKKQF